MGKSTISTGPFSSSQTVSLPGRVAIGHQLTWPIQSPNIVREKYAWWFGTWLCFPYHWECHHPNWRTHSIIFQRDREKPPSSKSMSGENPWISNGQIQQLSSVILLIFPWIHPFFYMFKRFDYRRVQHIFLKTYYHIVYGWYYINDSTMFFQSVCEKTTYLKNPSHIRQPDFPYQIIGVFSRPFPIASLIGLVLLGKS